MAEKTPASSRFWQVWALLGSLGTALAGGRLLYPASVTPERAATQATTHQQSPTLQPVLEASPMSAPGVDSPFARLAAAATSTERCTLLEQIEPSEDAQATYAITAVLERARLGTVRACATQALARQPTSEARSWLVDLAEDPEPEVHRSALDSLATRDEGSLAVVLEAAHSDDLELRVSAVNALLKAKRSEAFAAAAQALPLIEDEMMLSSLIDALGQSKDPQALPALEGLLENATRESHLQAISAIGALGVASAAARLTGFFEVGSNEEFFAATEAVRQLAPERVPAQLRAALASADRERQALALSAMLQLKLPDLPAIMREQLASGDATRENLVLTQLITTPDPSFEPDLIAYAEREDDRNRFIAMQALSRLDTPNARATLQRLSSKFPEALTERLLIPDVEENVDQARERRLAALSSATGVTPQMLYEVASDPSQRSQDVLLRYLAEHDLAGNTALVVQVAPAATVRRLIDRGASEALIEGLTRRADPQFTSALRENARVGSATRNSALTALVQLGDESVLSDLQQLAKSDDTTDRDLAVQLLATRNDRGASDELERLAADPSPQVVSSALHALQARSPELVARAAEHALREATPEDRASVLSSLSDLKATLSRPLLERSLNDADDSVALQAIQSLSNLQGPATAERLLSVANDSARSEDVRREAASALRTLGGPLARANAALLDSLSNVAAEEPFVCNN
ncbi:MAG TPA: HEAT repeat domain-containing protein [Polyangiaceae bacterium]|nr:HEAT repeat domain-containing protein [Polyangiaceae bacterium]